MKNPSRRTAEHEQITRAKLDVDEGRSSAIHTCETKHARIAEAYRNHRSIGRLLGVLMETESGLGLV